MKLLLQKYRYHFTDRQFVFSICIAFALLFGSLVVNFYAGTYAARQASNAVTDIILSNIRTFDLDAVFVYGSLVLVAFITVLGLSEPKQIPFILKSISLFVLIRSLFIIL